MDHPLIIVVGAGPVGLLSALLLSNDQVPVCLIDKNDTLQPSNELVFLGPTACALLEACDCLDAVLAQGTCFSELTLVLNAEQKQSLPWSLIAPTHPYVCALPCGALKNILHEALLEQGVQVMHNTTFMHVLPEGDLLTTHVLQEGEQKQITSRMLLAADGRHSTVRQSLSQTYHPWQLPQHTHVLLQQLPATHVANSMQLQAHHDGWSLHTEAAGQHHLEHMVLGDSLPTSPEAPAQRKALGPFHWLQTCDHSLRVLKHFSRGSVFFAGDAARCDGVVLSRSLNLGLQDAAAFSKHLRHHQIHQYAPEREKHSLRALQQWSQWARVLPNTLWRQWAYTFTSKQTMGQKAALRFWSGAPAAPWTFWPGRQQIEQTSRQES